jgi:hypothetical protein
LRRQQPPPEWPNERKETPGYDVQVQDPVALETWDAFERHKLRKCEQGMFNPPNWLSIGKHDCLAAQVIGLHVVKDVELVFWDNPGERMAMFDQTDPNRELCSE